MSSSDPVVPASIEASQSVDSKADIARKLLASIPKLSSLELESAEWIWPSLLVENGIHLISGEPGSLKSLLTLSAAIGIAQGNLWATPSAKRLVLYMDNENSKNSIIERALRLGLKDEEMLHYWGAWNENPPPAIEHPVYSLIAKEVKPIMIFDSLIRFANGRDENDASEMAEIMNMFKALRDLGATVIIIHHKGKARSEGPASPYRGSSEILAACDIGYSVTKKKEDAGWLLTLDCYKNRFQEEVPLKFHFNAETFSFTPEEVGVGSPEDVAAIIFAVERLGVATSATISTKSRVGQKTTEKILTAYLGSKFTMLKHRNQQLYQLVDSKGDTSVEA